MYACFFFNSFFPRLEWILDGFSTVALVLVLLGRAVDGLHWLEGWCSSPKHSIRHEKRLMMPLKLYVFLFFNWTSSWTPEEKTRECCSGKSTNPKIWSWTSEGSEEFPASSHLLKCFGADLPAAPETLTSADLWSPETLMWWMEQMEGDGNREGDLEGCHGYNSRRDPLTVNQHRETPSLC